MQLATLHSDGPYGIQYYEYTPYDKDIYDNEYAYVKYTIKDSVDNKGYKFTFDANMIVHSITIYHGGGSMYEMDQPLFTNGRDDIVAKDLKNMRLQRISQINRSR